jgi:4a-hydroxytetrahydrobiopterin dehydratase
MNLIPPDEVLRRLPDLPGWSLVGNAVVKQFAFTDFPAAVAFVNRIVPVAEAADHHPDITIHYRRVTLSYSTHSAGGITEKDFAGARAAERLVSP